MRLICVHLKIETVRNAVQSWNLFLAVYIGRKRMFSRSPVRLCGLVRKLWHAEKGICALFLAGATSKNVNFKEERLQNTYRPQDNLCPALSCALPTSRHLNLPASDCLPLCQSVQAFSSSPLFFLSLRGCRQLRVTSSCGHFFLLPTKRSVHWSDLWISMLCTRCIPSHASKRFFLQ